MERTFLGIEFGSTRIKAVLIDEEGTPLAQGGYDWENQLVDGYWSYSLKEIHKGLQGCVKSLKQDATKAQLSSLKAIGVSAMMHGYLAFDKDDNLLVPFRTWRNTTTSEASRFLTDLFHFPIPERWSISHLTQAILSGEDHVSRVDHVDTLAGYVHRKLTSRRVLGVGDASGMFPIDQETKSWREDLIKRYQEAMQPYGFTKDLHDILPEVLSAGKEAGVLTEEGARLLDPDGDIPSGIPLCPPEGDAGTGMVATNSVRKRTGNVSAGTSVFAMVVLEKPLKQSYPNVIDIVSTPDGNPVAMAHANNCTGDYDKWISLFGEAFQAAGLRLSKSELYQLLLTKALEGEADCGGLISYNYLSGESMTQVEDGRPLFVRSKQAKFTLANFMRSQVYGTMGALRTGMDVLFEKEHVQVDTLYGHGGFFKTPQVGQRLMAAALHTPLSVMQTAGEGGPWGMAILAGYLENGQGRTLQQYLSDVIFAHAESTTVQPDKQDMDGFDAYFKAYTRALPLERNAKDFIN